MKTFYYKAHGFDIECFESTRGELFWFARVGEKVVADGWTKLGFDLWDKKNDSKLDEYFKQNIKPEER